MTSTTKEMTKSELMVIKATPIFKAKVKEVAAGDNKSLSGYVTDLILKDFKKRKIKNVRAG